MVDESHLSSQTVKVLRDIVRQWTNSHKIKGYSSMKKSDLIDAMMKNMLFTKKEDDETLKEVAERVLGLKKKPVLKTKPEPTPVAKPPADTETVILDGERIKFKEGALRQQLRLTPNEKLTKSLIKEMLKKPVGSVIKYFNKERQMTPLLKKRLEFALTLMKGN